jgi:hypothetical protein
MTKKQKRDYNRHYNHWKTKMGFWFGIIKKNAPVDSYGFWVDAFASEDKEFIPAKLPYNYVIDIFCDVVAKSKVKEGKGWITSSPSIFYENNYLGLPLEKTSKTLFNKLLEILGSFKREKEFFRWYKENSRLIKVIY